jgi:hypothetical protein
MAMVEFPGSRNGTAYIDEIEKLSRSVSKQIRAFEGFSKRSTGKPACQTLRQAGKYSLDASIASLKYQTFIFFI